jgi:hypothetical protein
VSKPKPVGLVCCEEALGVSKAAGCCSGVGGVVVVPALDVTKKQAVKEGNGVHGVGEGHVRAECVIRRIHAKNVTMTQCVIRDAVGRAHLLHCVRDGVAAGGVELKAAGTEREAERWA